NWFAPSTLPAGTYQSYQPLSNLIGCPLNGEWTITVTDLWSIDNGNIFSWSIEFDKELFPDLETFELELTDWHWNNHPSIFYQEEDSIAAIPFNAGEVAYTFEVEDEFGCLWDTTVNIEVLPPTHPDCYTCSGLLADFPDTVICPESSVALDVSTVLSSSDITFESYDDYPIGAGNHPPAFPYLSTINVNSVNPLIITDPASDIVSVCLDLETDFDSDISLYLVTPTGQLFMLSTNNGGSGDNYTQTCFTPTAVTPITAGSPPFTGDFRPEGNWANLTGNPINGAWSLRVSDQFGVNALGRLNWWSITFQTDNSVTYSWSPPTGLSCTDCPDPVASPDDDITYTVTANDIYGCSAMEEIQISVQSDYFAPDIQLVDIPGGTVVATWNDVNPGTQYEVNVNNTGWVPSNNGNLSHMINGLNFGNTITVQVRSIVLVSICAVGIGSSSITYSYCTMDAVITTSEPFEVSCFGICDAAVSITELNGTAPYTYEVTNNTLGIMFTQPNGQLTMLCPGDYTVIVTDADDCKDTLEFEVLDKLPISIIATEYMPASCFGMSNGCATVQAIGGAGGFTYLWDDANASISDTVCGLPQGQYMVVATDQDGCTATATVLITQPDELDLQITATDANCLGGNDGTATATVTGGTQPYNYTWSGGSTPNDQTATGLVAGIYSVLVEDANGCQVSGDVTVGEPSDGLILTLTPFSGCNALNENRVESQVTGGTPPYQYAWTPTGETTPDIAGLPNGNFTLVVTDALGCTITETVFVQDLPDIEIELAFSPPTCHDGMDGAMAVNQVSGGTGMGYTYEWNTGDTDDFANGLLGGLVYTVTVTDSQGCEGVEGRSMPNPPPLEPVATITDATCNGYADGRVAITDVQNANGGVNFQWDDAAGNQTTPSAFNLAAGDYSVVITDSEGCSFSTVYTIGQPEPITADYVVVENECFGESQASIDPDVSGGTPGYAFQWSNGTTAAKLTAIPSGMYYVTITDANQCVKEDSVFVDQPDEVDIQVVVSDVSCFGGMDGSLTIEATGGTPPYRYSLDNNTYVGSSTLIALVAGDYSLFVQDANDCVYSQDAIINEPPELSVDIISNGENVDELTIFSGDRVLFDADITNGMGQVMYNWTAAWCGSLVCSADTTTDCNMDINCAFPIATPDFTNDYFLIIEDENGCTTEDHVQVHVRKIRVVEVPTGFTPNGDNNNDLLSVHGRSGTMIHLFQVFDRWGELLYQDVELPINDTSRGWDGTFKGKDMPPGVYVWYVEAEYADGMKDSFKGETTLIR
ncbi:MAG TPA: T9SS type B sorting domain-containing protein, partial [Bacteroidetes bacterium]|nr:T9SS type B sorting domain-containing protein [Bacteroidota bacterium]